MTRRAVLLLATLAVLVGGLALPAKADTFGFHNCRAFSDPYQYSDFTPTVAACVDTYYHVAGAGYRVLGTVKDANGNCFACEMVQDGIYLDINGTWSDYNGNGSPQAVWSRYHYCPIGHYHTVLGHFRIKVYWPEHPNTASFYNYDSPPSWLPC